MSTLLTYVTEDRSRVIMVWEEGDYSPRMITLPDGSPAHLTGYVHRDEPQPSDYVFSDFVRNHVHEIARKWWDDDIAPFPDPVIAKQIKEECETFDELYARIQYAVTDEKTINEWT